MTPSSSHQRGGGQDRWLLSYADFVTLLFALFVTMYAVSTVDKSKLAPAASSMQSAFDGETREAVATPLTDLGVDRAAGSAPPRSGPQRAGSRAG